MLLSKRPECSFLISGQPISHVLKDAVFGILMVVNLLMSIVGIGTNLLGYGHPEVDDAVSALIFSGNMSTLNCPESFT